MSRSSFASFHLTGIKPSSGKLMTSSVDRLFENEGDVFISSNYNDFNQVNTSFFLNIIKFFELKNKLFVLGSSIHTRNSFGTIKIT